MKTDGKPPLDFASICIHLIFICGNILLATGAARAQPECNGWGGLRGIRIDGQLMPFLTNLIAVKTAGAETVAANQSVTNPHFSHAGSRQICSGEFRFQSGDTLDYIETIDDLGRGVAKVDLSVTAIDAVQLDGIYFAVDLPGLSIPLSDTRPSDRVILASPTCRLEIALAQASDIVMRGQQVRFTIGNGELLAGQTRHSTFTITASGNVETQPIHLTLDCTHPGRTFDGIGGNFRLQNPTADPPAIQYNLDHLPVAWGRVSMPLNDWQPDETADPAAREPAKSVREAMAMAGELAKRKIPIIASVWVAPDWALAPDAPATSPTGRRLRGRLVKHEKMDALCDCIASYLLYMRDHFGAEAELFSFNESNLGIDVRQTPEDHAEMIKRLGALLQARGLKTKMLLGDTSDARALDFLDAAMADPLAIPYIGAVSFHSWRGGNDAVFTGWGAAAAKLNLPLLCAEGGTDPDAWKYPAIFEEPWFALDEINLYIRICSLCQPASIMQWQLTSDYALVSGGHGGTEVKPLKRFWQLKQLGLTPPGSRFVTLRADQANVSCCAMLGDRVVIHLVNSGAARQATLSGLPPNVRELNVYVTDASRNMAELPPISVASGTANFTLDPASFITLVSNP